MALYVLGPDPHPDPQAPRDLRVEEEHRLQDAVQSVERFEGRERQLWVGAVRGVQHRVLGYYTGY